MKRLIAISTACLLAFTACGGKTDSSLPSEITTEASVTPVSDSKKPAETNEIIPLNHATAKQLQNTKLIFYVGNKTYYSGNILTEFTSIADNNKIINNNFEGDYYLRSSSGIITANESEKEKVKKYFKDIPFDNLYYYQNKLGLDFTKPVLTLNGFSENPALIKTEDITLGFETIEEITANAFVSRTGTDTCNIIIDPAYMQGLPMMTDKLEDMEFSINGREIMADTLEFEADYKRDGLSSYFDKYYKYIYAEICFTISCKYSPINGYSSTGRAYIKKLLTTDTNSVLDGKFNSFHEDNTDSLTVYNAVMDDISEIMSDNTIGMSLLDLNFDGTPELIVSDFVERRKDNSNIINAKIYSLKSGKAEYIDTLYNTDKSYSNGNILGLKTLGDGSKAWYTVSRINRNDGNEYFVPTQYLFTLENNKLEFTEVFSLGYDQIYKDDNEVYSGEVAKIYFMGEEIFPEISVDNNQSENPATIYSYNGTEAMGGLWVLGYKLMEKYAEDMTNSTYTLSSDWLVSKDETNRAFGFRLIPMTETMLKNSISRMIKSFYSGENESALKQYNYVFFPK